MIMTRSSTHSNEQSLSLDHIGRETRGGSGRGPVTNTECMPALSCAATPSSIVILTLLFVSVQPSSLSLFFPPLPPIFPSFSLSPSSHHWRWGQLHSVTGVGGGQCGPPHHPHQRFRHQPKVSFVPAVPSAFCLSLFSPR